MEVDEEIVLDLVEDGPHDSNRFLDMDLDPSIILVTDYEYKYIESYQELDFRPRVLRAFQEDVNACRPTHLYSTALQMITSKSYKSLLIQGRRKSDLDKCYVVGLLERIKIHELVLKWEGLLEPVKVKEEENPQALVICPTFEMANQIRELVLKLGRYTSICSYVQEDPEDDVMPADACIVFTSIKKKSLIVPYLTYFRLFTTFFFQTIYQYAHNCFQVN